MATTYLTRTQKAGNRQTFTQSFWVKLSNTTDQGLISSFKDSNNYSYCYIDSSTQQLQLQWKSGGSVVAQLNTNRVFRDTSGWYNIIYAVDTTKATGADRIKLYVNGVQETSFATATYPGQISSEVNDNGTTQYIGSVDGTQQYLNGSMSYVAQIDGTQELPGIFGETDSTTGEWKIKTTITPSVGWGNNGFLILKNGNSVTDQSGSSNDFAYSGGTLTNTEDCPDNVFCVLNELDKNSNITLGSGNTEYIATNGWYNVRGSFFVSSGKYYWEMKKTTTSSTFTFIGAATSEPPLDFGYGGAQNGLFAYGANNGNKIGQGTASTAYGASFATGDIMGIALDMDNGTITFYKNGATQGQAFSGITGDVAPWITGYDNKNEYNFGNGTFGTTAVASPGTNASGNGIFEYDVPTGFTALSTKGLNL